jgi:glycogen(starch) synthase
VSRPHVLLTTDVVGGVWDFSITLASVLDARVTLLALGNVTAQHRLAASRAGADFIAAPLKLEWMQDAEHDVLRTRQIVSRVIRDVGADLLHANQFAAACADTDVPVVLTVHSDVLSWHRWTLGRSADSAEWSTYVLLVREALARADRVTAVSRFLAKQVREHYATDRQLEVIYNGWSPPAFLGKKESITLLAGRAWDAAKNIGLIAEAAHGWDPGPVYLAGDQQHPESNGHFPIPESVQPLGYQTRADLDGWLAKARLYVSPARYDPFGLLPLQAALHGCALLLSDIPSYRELWDGAARFFHSDDAGDLRGQWQSLLEDPDRIASLAEAAHHRAAERYGSATMATAYQALYAAATRGVAA